MPWQESDTMDQRLQFVRDALSERFDMTELCLRYGVSRRIGYKWLARFEEEGNRASRTEVGGRTRVRPRFDLCLQSCSASFGGSIQTGARVRC
jgi:transposase-like protein